MGSTDMFFKTGEFVFSYRLAGILIRDGKVLLTHTVNDPGFAFPGGHASYPETNEQTLIREFKEEISADIQVKELKWVGEIFFPWFDGTPCQQISLYYEIELRNESQIPLTDSFMGTEFIEGQNFNLEFVWMDIMEIDSIQLYPHVAKAYLKDFNSGVKHFVDRQIET